MTNDSGTQQDPVTKDQSKYIDVNGRLRYSADGSLVFPGPTGVRRWHPADIGRDAENTADFS